MNSVIPTALLAGQLGQLAQIDPLTLGLRSVVPAVGVTILALVVFQVPSLRPSPDKPSPDKPSPDKNRRETHRVPVSTHWALPMALGLGFFACYVGIHGWPPASWYPDMKARLGWAAIGAGLFGAIRSRNSSPKPRHLPWKTPLFFLVCSAWLLWHWHARGMWDSTLTWVWILGATLVASSQVGALESLARLRPGPALPMAFGMAAALASLSFFLSHSESHARLGVGLAACLTVAAAAALWRPDRFGAHNSVLVFVTLFDGLALANTLTADLPPTALALILIAPLGVWLPEAPLLRKKGRLLRWAVGFTSIAAPLALAAWQAHLANPPYGY